MDVKARATELLCKLISFKSDQEEREIAGFIGDRLRKSGFDIEIQVSHQNPDRENMIAKIGAPGGKRLLFEGHLDVVPAGNLWTVPPFEGTVKGENIFGRGSVDMKSGITAMTLAAEQLATDKALLERNQIILCFVYDEERQCQGIKQYLFSAAFSGADYAVIGEPTGLNICICHRGSCHYKIKIHGSASHAAKPQEGINAIEKAMKALRTIEEYSEHLKMQPHEFLDVETMTPTVIRAGILDNMIPDTCEIIVDARLFPGKTAETAMTPLCRRLDCLAAEDTDFSYEIEIIQEALGGEVHRDSPLVRTAADAYRKVFSKSAELHGFGVTCEQSFLVRAGVPTIVFGPGDCSLAHTPDENVKIQDMEHAYHYYCELTRSLLI